MITASHPDLPVLVVTATNEIETAVQCMREGAMDYLLKPVEKNRMVASVNRALEIRGLREEVFSLKQRLLSDELLNPETFAGIVTQSKSITARPGVVPRTWKAIEINNDHVFAPNRRHMGTNNFDELADKTGGCPICQTDLAARLANPR